MKNIFYSTIFFWFLLGLSEKTLQAQWVQTNGPFFDAPYSIQKLALIGSELYAGTWGGGVFRSSDNGLNWTSVNTGLTNLYVSSLVAIGEDLFVSTDNGGLFRLVADGSNWETTALSARVLSIATNGVTLFAGTWGGGIFYSTDKGSNWTETNFGIDNPNAMYVHSVAVNGTEILAGTQGGGIIRSSDNGASWSGINSNLPNLYVYSVAIVGTTLLSAPEGSGVFRSTDNGITWTACGLTNQYVHSIVVNGSELFAIAGTHIGGGTHLFHSTNLGDTWTEIDLGATTNGFEITSIAVDGVNIFGGTVGGSIFYSVDYGAIWQEFSNSLTQKLYCNMSDILIYPDGAGGNNIVVATNNGYYLSTNQGSDWEKTSIPISNSRSFVVHANGTLYSGTTNGVFRSTDFGVSWNLFNNGLTDTLISALSVDSVGNVLAGTSNGRIFELSNASNAWTIITDSGLLPRISNMIRMGSKLIVGSYPVSWGSCGGKASELNKKTDSFSGNIFVSSDNGQSWIQTGIPNMATSKMLSFRDEMYAVETAVTDPCCMCNCFYPNPVIMKSVDYGMSWQVDSTFTDSTFTESYILQICKSDRDIYCSNQAGVYVLKISGWVNASDNLNTAVYTITTDGQFLYAATSSGVWKRPLSEVRSDTSAPTIVIAALSTPAVNAVRFGIGANEFLTSAELTVNSQPVTLTKEGDLCFGTYLVNGPGSLNVHATATDLSSNTTQTDRSYTVVDLNKSGSFLGFSMKSEDKGYAVLSPSELPQAPSNWEPIGSAIEMLNTNPAADIIIEAFYSDFNHDEESKIGLYEYLNGNWEYVGGHGKNGKVTATIHGGTIAVFYNPDQTAVPGEFSLSQNYPNPFNPTTRLRYNVATQSLVKMKIYNILGQEVRTLVNAMKEPGFYEVTWDGRSDWGVQVASGMYLYRMEAGKFIQTRKMLFVK